MKRALLALPFVASCASAPKATLPAFAARAVPPCAEIPVPNAPPPAPRPTVTTATDRLAAYCPPGMIALPSFCIDQYEAPNVRGELPLALETAPDGERWCAERGKRLCYDDEWVRACEGPRGHRFPYGDEHRAGACNDDRPWLVVAWSLLARWPDGVALAEATRLFQGDMSGARADCVSDEGVFDLTGNVAEWVRRRGPAPRPGYEHVLKGCYWAGCFKDPLPSCAFTNSGHPGAFRTYEAGFRCCSDRLARPAASGLTSGP